MKAGFVVIATLCLFSEIHPALSKNVSNGEFSSLLETVVGDAITQPFRINGGNGYCAHTSNWIYMQLYICGSVDRAQRFTLYSDGTIRAIDNSKCLTARGLTQGSLVEPDNCNNPNQKAITWQVTDRQILHPESGLALSAMYGTSDARFTLEVNVFSSYQTFRLDYGTPVPSAHIIGMNGLCLLSSNNQVWLGACGSSGSASQKWNIYPDGTIRPQQRSNGCLGFDTIKSSRVLVTTCGLAPSTERWILTENGTLLNERFNLALDVAAADPSLRKIVVYSPTGAANQRWRIFYD